MRTWADLTTVQLLDALREHADLDWKGRTSKGELVGMAETLLGPDADAPMLRPPNGTSPRDSLPDDPFDALRAPFPPEMIGKLPKIACSACSKAPGKVCDKHTKRDCAVCHAYMTERHIHLDYVGHAAVTDRLLQVDPEWTWEPVAFDADGGPLVRVRGNEASLWIRLTVSGMTRLGVGIVTAGSFELDKQLISDALRNAAMRFGVALDLWSKEDLRGDPEGDNGHQEQQTQAPAGPVLATVEDIAALKAWMEAAPVEHQPTLQREAVERFGPSKDLEHGRVSEVIDWIEARTKELVDATPPPSTEGLVACPICAGTGLTVDPDEGHEEIVCPLCEGEKMVCVECGQRVEAHAEGCSRRPL